MTIDQQYGRATAGPVCQTPRSTTNHCSADRIVANSPNHQLCIIRYSVCILITVLARYYDLHQHMHLMLSHYGITNTC